MPPSVYTNTTTRRYDPPGALEWCDQNMHLNYPLDAAATGKSRSNVGLPQSFLVDLQLVLPYIETTPGTLPLEDRFFISSVIVNDDSIIVEISVLVGSATGTPADGQSFVCARSGAISKDIGSTDPLSTRRIPIGPVPISYPGYAELQGLTGDLVVGTCVDMSNLGTLTFAYGASHITAMRVFMSSRTMDGITFIAADEQSHLVTSDFVLQAGDGIDFRYEQSTNTVYVERVPTAAELSATLTTVDEVLRAIRQALGSPIYTINGLPPGATGNFVINGGDCTNISSSDSGLVISNTCSQPCCVGSEGSDTTAALATLESAEARLLSYYQDISTKINTLQARLSSLLASRH